MSLLAWVVWLLPQVVLPRAPDLYAMRHDEVELERLATRLGPSRLLLIAAAGNKGQRVAALRGLSLSGARHPELAASALLPLSDLLEQTREKEVQEAAVEAASHLCQGIGRGLPSGDEVGGDELPRAAAAFLRLAGDAALAPPLRGHLVEAAVALPGGLARAPELLALARGQDPVVRDAALAGLGGLFGRIGEPEGEGLSSLARGEDAALAAAAVAVLCEVSAARPQPSWAERARSLAAPQSGLSLEDRQRLGGCLRRLGTSADRALLSALRGPRQRPAKERR